MEAIQLAQMLADLNDLQAAQDQAASKALVDANKTLDRKSQHQHQHQHKPNQPPPRSVPESPALTPHGGRRATDKFGRFLFTPPLSRHNSGSPSTVPGTPKEESLDADINRASTLLSLYEIRAKLKEQDSSSLQKAREKVNALAAKQAQMSGDQRRTPTGTVTGVGTNQSQKTSHRISYPK